MAQLNIVLPGLLGPLAELEDYPLALPEFKILSRILSRSRHVEDVPNDYLSSLTYLLSCSAPLSVATISAVFDDLPDLINDSKQATKTFFLRADPVHFKTEMDHAVLLDQHRLNIFPEEAESLINTFNQHFKEDNLILHCRDARRWYLEFPQALDIQTTNLPQAIARNVHNFLPQGTDAINWRRILNEAQMLFHEHPVNQRRESAGQLSINSLWLWGEQTVTIKKPFNQTISWIMSEDELAAGLAKIKTIKHYDMATDYTQLTGNGVLVLNAAAAPVSYGDIDAWLAALENIVQQWLEPLLKILEKKQFEKINLYTADGQLFEVSRSSLLMFWRRKKWSHFISSTE